MAPPEHSRDRLEEFVRYRTGRGVLDQATAAAAARLIKKLVRKHPLVAAEVAIAGVSRGTQVGLQEVWARLKSTAGQDDRGKRDKHRPPLSRE